MNAEPAVVHGSTGHLPRITGASGHAPLSHEAGVECGACASPQAVSAPHDAAAAPHPHGAPAEHHGGAPVHPHAASGVPAARPAPTVPTTGRLAARGAGHAAILGGALSALRNVQAAARGEKTPAEAARDTVVDTAASAASGALVGALSGVAGAALRGAGLGLLARTAAPVAVGLTAVEIGRDTLALSRRQIEARDFNERVVVHVFRGGTTWVGLELGAVLGTLGLPGFGTTVGAFLGGVLGYRLGSWLAERRPGEED